MKKNLAIIFFLSIFSSQLLPGELTPSSNALKKVKYFIWNRNFLLGLGGFLLLGFLRHASKSENKVSLINSNLTAEKNETSNHYNDTNSDPIKGNFPKTTNPEEKKQQVNYISDVKNNNQDEEYLKIVKNIDIESIKKYVKEKKTLYEISFDIRPITPFQWNLIVSDCSSEEIGNWCKNDAFLLQKLKDSQIPTITSILQTILKSEKDVGKNVDFSKIHAFFDYLSKNYLPELIVTFDYSNACEHSSSSRECNYARYINFPLEYITEITKVTFPESLKKTLKEIFRLIDNTMNFLFVSSENFNENHKQLFVSIMKYLPELFFRQITKVTIEDSQYQTLPKNLLDNFVLPLGNYLTKDEIFYFNNQLISYISQGNFNFYNIILLLDIYKNHKYLTLDECKAEIKGLFAVIQKQTIEEKDLDRLYFYNYILKILNSSEIDAFLIDSIKENIEALLPSIFSKLLENAKIKNTQTVYQQNKMFIFFYNQSLVCLENPTIKKLWEEQWRQIIDIMVFQSNNSSFYIKVSAQCHCEIRREIKNQPDLLILKSLLWDQKKILGDQKIFLSYCLERGAFELVICIFEGLKEIDLNLYKTLLNLCKFELCTALFQHTEKNAELISVLREYATDFFKENYQQKNEYIKDDLATCFINAMIDTKNNEHVYKFCDYSCEHKGETSYFGNSQLWQMFFNTISPALFEYVVDAFSILQENDFFTDFSYVYKKFGKKMKIDYENMKRNMDFIESVRCIGTMQFNKNIHHNKKTIFDIVPFKALLLANLSRYPFLLSKNQEGIMRFNKIIDQKDKEYCLKMIFKDFVDFANFSAKDPLLDDLILYMKKYKGDPKRFAYYFDYVTTLQEGDTYQKRAHSLINYMLSKGEYNITYCALLLLENEKLLIKNDILINAEQIIKCYTENGKVKKDQKNNMWQFLYFLREFVDPEKIDKQIAIICLDYYAYHLQKFNNSFSDKNIKAFLRSLIKKVDLMYNPLKMILILSQLCDEKLLENYKPYLEKIGFKPEDFINLESFIFPLMKAYNYNVKNKPIDWTYVEKIHKKLIRYLVKKNIEFFKNYTFDFISKLIGKPKEIRDDSMAHKLTLNNFVIPDQIIVDYLEACEKVTLNNVSNENIVLKKDTIKNLSKSRWMSPVMFTLMYDFFKPYGERIGNQEDPLKRHRVLALLDPLFEKDACLISMLINGSIGDRHAYYFKYLLAKQVKNIEKYNGKKNNLLHSLLLISSGHDEAEFFITECKQKIENFNESAKLLSLKNHEGKTPLDLEKEMYPEMKKSCFSELPNLK